MLLSRVSFPKGSGRKGSDGEKVLWMKLFLRGDSAREVFDDPPLGTSIEVGQAG